MKIKNRSVFSIILTIIMSLLSLRTLAQNNIECGPDNLDGGFCGCDYGYYTDGSCLPPPDGGGGTTSCNMNNFYYTYTDGAANDDGSFSAWTITQNTDGNQGEGTLYAAISITFPDGTVMPNVTATSTSSSSVEAYLQTPVVPDSEFGSGQISTGSYISWYCGTSAMSYATVALTLSSDSQVYDCSSSGGSTPYIGTCSYRCGSPQKSGTFEFPLYRIQKACPPPRSTCPTTLRASITEIQFFGIDFGIPHVIGNSCIYTPVQ